MAFAVVARLVGSDGEEDWLPGMTLRGIPLGAGVCFGRAGVADPNPALQRIAVDPRWLDRGPADHGQVPRQLLVIVPDGPRGVRWWITTGQPQAFRIHVGPYAGQAAPPLAEAGTVALQPGASCDIEVWIAAHRGWRPVLRVRVERSPAGTVGGGRDGLDEPTAGPRQSVSESYLKAWIQEDLGEVQRHVLWATVQHHEHAQLREAVQRSTGVTDVPTKWANIAKNLARFVARHPDPATGRPWLQNLIEYPGLPEHLDEGARLRAGEDDLREFAAFLARFPGVSRWGW